MTTSMPERNPIPASGPSTTFYFAM
jgi:hypothetical protein